MKIILGSVMNNLPHPVTGKPQYLEVKVPQTTDGKTLAYDANRQPIFKTKYLPITAKKRLEQRNQRLPQELRLIIDVKINQPEPVITSNVEVDANEPPKPRGVRKKNTQNENE
jgi:hypothetical protein